MSCGAARCGAGVVIIGRNEAACLPGALDSARIAAARAADMLGISVDLVYVDSYSGDGSREIARARGVRTAVPPRRFMTPANGRNTGLYLVAGEYVMFMDGDMELAPDWLARGIAFLEARPGAAGVDGIRDDLRLQGGREVLLRNYTRAARPVAELRGDLGGACLFRRAALLQTGGFDPSLQVGEEAVLYCQLREKGWKLYRLAVPMALHRDTKIARPGTALRHLVFTRTALVPGQVLRHALFATRWGLRYAAYHRHLFGHALWLLLTGAAAALSAQGIAAALVAGYAALLAYRKRSPARGLAALFLRTAYLGGLCAGFALGGARCGAQRADGYWREIRRLNAPEGG